MASYLTGSDLDDTLLTSKKKIKMKTKRFIRKYVKRKNIFCICTGRPFTGAKEYWSQLPKGMPLVTDNGGAVYLYSNGELKIHFTGIDLKIFKEFLKEIDEYILGGITTFLDTIYLQGREYVPKFVIHEKVEGVSVKEGKFIDILDTTPLLPTLWLKEDSLDTVLEILKKYQKHIAYHYWGCFNGRHHLEMHNPNASKGNGLAYVAKYYKINKKNICAFGDAYNDVSMFENANHGIAMCNAPQNIIDQAKDKTRKDFNHNGVVDYLKHHKLY